MRTNKEIIDQTNELARRLLSLQGFKVPDGHRFEHSRNPRDIIAWAGAREAQLLLTDTDPHDAVYEEMEEAEQTEVIAEAVKTGTLQCVVYKCTKPAACWLHVLGDWGPFCKEHAENRDPGVPWLPLGAYPKTL
jgi:hypothetical protein